MKDDIIKLDEDDISTAIGFYLEAQGASADVGTLKFSFDANGQLLGTLEGQLAGDQPAEDLPSSGSHPQVSMAITQRACIDVFTAKEIPEETRSLWVEEVGVTTVHPVEWPDDVKSNFTFTPDELREFSEHLGLMKSSSSSSEASTASDILGSEDSGPVDRSSALEDGLKET